MKFLPFFFLLAACAGGAKDDRVTTILGLTGDTAAGETLYGTQCIGCHGADATGGSGSNLVAAYAEGEDEESLDIIINGDGDMPAFGESLSDQDIADLAAYYGTK